MTCLHHLLFVFFHLIGTNPSLSCVNYNVYVLASYLTSWFARVTWVTWSARCSGLTSFAFFTIWTGRPRFSLQIYTSLILRQWQAIMSDGHKTFYNIPALLTTNTLVQITLIKMPPSGRNPFLRCRLAIPLSQFCVETFHCYWGHQTAREGRRGPGTHRLAFKLRKLSCSWSPSRVAFIQ